MNESIVPRCLLPLHLRRCDNAKEMRNLKGWNEREHSPGVFVVRFDVDHIPDGEDETLVGDILCGRFDDDDYFVYITLYEMSFV